MLEEFTISEDNDQLVKGAAGDDDDPATTSLPSGFANSRPRSVSSSVDGQRKPPSLFSRNRKRPPAKFQPWETLLLLDSAENLQREVLEGTLLWRFLEICDPTLS